MEIDDLLLNDESNLIVLTNSDDEYGNADISAFLNILLTVQLKLLKIQTVIL